MNDSQSGPLFNPNPHYPNPHQPEPPRRGPATLLVLLGVGGFLLVAGALAVGVVMMLMRTIQPAGADVAAVVVDEDADTAEQARQLRDKYREIAAAYDRPRLGQTAELDDVERLILRLSQAIANKDGLAFDGMVDHQRHAREILGGWFKAGYSARLTADSLQFAVPYEGDSVELVHVTFADNRQTAIAYTYVWTDDIATKCRFWITWRGSHGPRLYDWENLDIGLRASREAWLLTTASDHESENYRRASREVQQARSLAAQYQHEEGIAQLKRASKYRLPRPLDEHLAVQFGFAWATLGEHDEAIQWHRRAAAGGRVPGAAWGQAVYHQGQGEHAEALAAIEKYEAMLGRGPDSSAIRAAALAALNHADEASDVYFEVLRMQPTNVEALSYLCRKVPPEQQPKLLEHFKQLGDVGDDPARSAATVQALQSLIYLAPTAYLEAALQQLALSGDAGRRAEVLNLRGQMLEKNFELEAALDAYAEAIEVAAEPHRAEQYRDAYLYLMHTMNRYSEAYAKAEDKPRAFRFFLFDLEYDYEEALPDWAREKLLSRHGEQFPEDLWYQAARAVDFCEAKDWQAAVELLETLVDEIEEEDRYRVTPLYLTAMANLGRGEEAYRRYAGTPGHFQQVADAVLASSRSETLDQVIAAHAMIEPEDPWPRYYAALRLQDEGKPDAAIAQLVSLGKEDFAAEYEYARVTNLLWRLQLKAKQSPSEIVAQAADPKAAFEFVARHLQNASKWDELSQLLDEVALPAEATLPYEIALAVEQHDYERLIDLATPWPPAALESLAEWRRTPIRTDYFVALVKQGQLDRAADLAQQVQADEQDATLQAILLARGDDVDGLRALLETRGDAEQVVAAILRSELASEHFHGESFAELRQAFPVRSYNLAPEGDWRLLMKGDQPITQARIEQAARQALGDDAAVTPLAELDDMAADSEPMLAAFLVTGQQRRFVISQHARDADNEQTENVRFDSDELRRAVEGHQSVVVVAEPYHPWQTSVSTEFRKLVAALAVDESILAVAGESGTLVANDEPARAAVRDAATWPRFAAEQGTAFWGGYNYPDWAEAANEAEAIAKAEETNRRNRMIQQAIQDFKPGETVLRVGFRNSLGAAVEILWLDVQAIEHGEYGAVTFRGTLHSDSHFYPVMQAGTAVRVDKYHVTEFAR